MNLQEWLQSKKTKDMLVTQASLAALGLGVLYLAEGDPEKAKALLSSIKEVLVLIAGVGGVKIATQGAVDIKKASQPSEPKES